jgi:hypothetical protein
MKRILPILSLLFVSHLVSFGEDNRSFEKEVQPFLEKYCIHCHNEKKQKGKFRLDNLSHDFGLEDTAQRWAEVIFRINAGEMPPKEEEKLPTRQELSDIVDWLSARITEGQANRMAKRGPVNHYRLSRDEYANTVYDLLGVHYDPHLPGAFNEDPRWHGFERIGSLLSLSPSHVNRYFNAADIVLERAFPIRSPKPRLTRKDANEKKEEWLEKNQLDGRVRWLMWPEKRIGGMNIQEEGTYRIKIQLSGMPSLEGRLPHLSIWHSHLKRSIWDMDINAPEDKPMLLDFELVLSKGGYQLMNVVPQSFNPVGNHTLNVTNSGDNIFVRSDLTQYLNPTGYKLFTDEGHAIHPTLIVDWIEYEGPITSEADIHKRAGMLPTAALENIPATDDPKILGPAVQEARKTFKHFATKAWRRDVPEIELEPYLSILERELASKVKFRDAYLAALTGMLTSKNFYYIEEGSIKEPRNHLNNWELASRLSYFLWGSMPDDALFEVARNGQLLKDSFLEQQINRMLSDPKLDRFVSDFPKQWLQLHRLGMFPPDLKLYPDYDNWLEQSMALESKHFFEEILKKNLSIREFLTSEWTMVNPRLAMHYGLPTPVVSGFQKISLRPEDQRGGILSQASVLSLTSDGTRHRPVHRGVLVWETIFARTPPPPPPNVEPLEPTPVNKPKATIRDQLEAHATHDTCASCHRKIDPLGFAFDNYDAIGRWRVKEIVSTGKGENPEVDASGELVDGRKFNGPAEFKKLLADDIDKFAVAFTEQLATFALRRVLTIDDKAQIEAIAKASKKEDYRLQEVLRHLITSDLFKSR